MKKSDRLFKAADIMLERGWCVSFLLNEDNECCFRGAILLTDERIPESVLKDHFRIWTSEWINHPTVRFILDEVDPLGFEEGILSCQNSAEWNNYVAKDADEVAHALKQIGEAFAYKGE